MGLSPGCAVPPPPTFVLAAAQGSLGPSSLWAQVLWGSGVCGWNHSCVLLRPTAAPPCPSWLRRGRQRSREEGGRRSGWSATWCVSCPCTCADHHRHVWEPGPGCPQPSWDVGPMGPGKLPPGTDVQGGCEAVGPGAQGQLGSGPALGGCSTGFGPGISLKCGCAPASCEGRAHSQPWMKEPSYSRSQEAPCLLESPKCGSLCPCPLASGKNWVVPRQGWCHQEVGGCRGAWAVEGLGGECLGGECLGCPCLGFHVSVLVWGVWRDGHRLLGSPSL